MTSEELYSVIDDPAATPAKKLKAWQKWCKDFDEREAYEACEATVNKKYEL